MDEHTSVDVQGGRTRVGGPSSALEIVVCRVTLLLQEITLLLQEVGSLALNPDLTVWYRHVGGESRRKIRRTARRLQVFRWVLSNRGESKHTMAGNVE